MRISDWSSDVCSSDLQSLAIIEYLDEVYPDPPLIPGDSIERAKIRSMVQIVACDIHPINNLRVLKHLRKQIGLDQERSEERRVGKECVSTCRSRWSPHH